MTLGHAYVSPHELWGSWSLDPAVVAGLVVASALYWRGAVRLRRNPAALPIRRVVSFAAGMGALVVALISPLDGLAATLFSVHMAQHLLLIVVAAPLIVYSAPVRTTMRGFPSSFRRRLLLIRPRRSSRWMFRLVTHPVVVWVLHVSLLWAWHLPSTYRAAVVNEGVHALEHVGFLGTAVLFWGLVIQNDKRRRLGYGGGTLFVFAGALQSSALGAILLFAPRVLYPVHVAGAHLWDVQPLADQQIAGATMWIPTGIVYFATIFVLAARWMHDIETRMRRKERRLTPVGEGR